MPQLNLNMCHIRPFPKELEFTQPILIPINCRVNFLSLKFLNISKEDINPDRIVFYRVIMNVIEVKSSIFAMGGV